MNQSKKGLAIFCLLLFVAVFLAIGTNNPYQSRLFRFGDSLAVINIVGTISVDDGYTYNQQDILDAIDECTQDPSNQGIVLYIDSPGGTIYETDEVYWRLMDYKNITGNPIYAAIGHYGASGAYYIANACDEIYANRNGLTGSIGVLMGSHVDLTGLFEKLGIEMETFASGSNKNMLGIDEPLTDEQRNIMQSILDEAYEQFVEIVAQGREMSVDEVRLLADGRIYTAKQAEACGLIDGVETFEETLNRALKRTGVDYNQVYYYSYEADQSIWDFLLNISNTIIKSPRSALSAPYQDLTPEFSGLAYYHQF